MKKKENNSRKEEVSEKEIEHKVELGKKKKALETDKNVCSMLTIVFEARGMLTEMHLRHVDRYAYRTRTDAPRMRTGCGLSHAA